MVDQLCGFSGSSVEVHVTMFGSMAGLLEGTWDSDPGSLPSRLTVGVDFSRSGSGGFAEEAEDIFCFGICEDTVYEEQ